LEEQLEQARSENLNLKAQLKQCQKENEEEAKANKLPSALADMKARDSFEPLKVRTNDYANTAEDSKLAEKSKVRSVSVEATLTQKCLIPKANDRKVAVPKYSMFYVDSIFRCSPITMGSPTNPSTNH
jgi:hypothetical protein